MKFEKQTTVTFDRYRALHHGYKIVVMGNKLVGYRTSWMRPDEHGADAIHDVYYRGDASLAFPTKDEAMTAVTAAVEVDLAPR